MNKTPFVCAGLVVSLGLVWWLFRNEQDTAAATASVASAEPNADSGSQTLVGSSVKIASAERQAFLKSEIERGARIATTDALYDIAHPALTEWLETRPPSSRVGPRRNGLRSRAVIGVFFRKVSNIEANSIVSNCIRQQ